MALPCGRGSVGRASPCQGEGRRFESGRPLRNKAQVRGPFRGPRLVTGVGLEMRQAASRRQKFMSLKAGATTLPDAAIIALTTLCTHDYRWTTLSPSETNGQPLSHPGADKLATECAVKPIPIHNCEDARRPQRPVYRPRPLILLAASVVLLSVGGAYFFH
jgi:hypothetical protein